MSTDSGKKSIVAQSGEEKLTIHWRLADWFKDLDPSVLNSLKTYHQELLKFNKTLNLIGVKTISHADAIHFADSITAARHVYKVTGDSEIYDLGTGNGFPGLVMAILYPKMRVVIVSSDSRKLEFLNHLTTQLRLSNTKVLNTQAERLAEYSVKHALCRGTSNISKTILGLRKVVQKGGLIFHFKGEEWSTEVADIPTQLCRFWKPGLLAEYKLPIGEVSFALVGTEKIED